MSFDLKKARDVREEKNISALRVAVFIVAGVQALLPLGLIVFIARHADPRGDGMEWVGVFPALILAALFAIPPLIWSVHNRRLTLGLLVAIAGALVNLIFYMEVASELGHLVQ